MSPAAAPTAAVLQLPAASMLPGMLPAADELLFTCHVAHSSWTGQGGHAPKDKRSALRSIPDMQPGTPWN